MDKTSSGVWLHGRCGFVDGKTFKAGTTFWNPCEFGKFIYVIFELELLVLISIKLPIGIFYLIVSNLLKQA